MTPAQLSVLFRAADREYEPGTSILFEANNGFMRQVRWLLGKKFVRFAEKNTRVVATVAGVAALEAHARDVARRHAKRSDLKADRLLVALERGR